TPPARRPPDIATPLGALLIVCRRKVLDANLPNPNARIYVPLARLLAEVFATSHLLDDKFLALLRPDHFGRYVCPLHERAAEFGIAVATHRQHAIKRNLPARRHVAVVDDEFLAFFDSVLAASVGNDRVHGLTRSCDYSHRFWQLLERSTDRKRPAKFIWRAL